MRNRTAILSAVVFTALVAFALVPATFSLANEGSSPIAGASNAASSSSGASMGSPSASGSSPTGSSIGSSSSGSGSASNGSSASGSSPADSSSASGSSSSSGSGSGSGSGSNSGSSALLAQSASDLQPLAPPVYYTIEVGQDGVPTSSGISGVWSFQNIASVGKLVLQQGYRFYFSNNLGNFTSLLNSGTVAGNENTINVAVYNKSSGIIESGTFNIIVENLSGACIKGGTYNSEVKNSSKIENGTFNGYVRNILFTGTTGSEISGGTFTHSVDNWGGLISGGTYNCTVLNNTVSYIDSYGTTVFQGVIKGGTFNGDYVEGRGIIDGGTFNCDVNCQAKGSYAGVISNGTFTASSHVTLASNCSITGGTFNCVVDSAGNIKGGTFGKTVNSSGTIDTGTFNDSVSNSGTINNGSFAYQVTNQSNGNVAGGTFDRDVINNGTISGGAFSGGVTNRGTIAGGTYANIVTNGSGASITGGTFNNYILNSGSVTGGTLLGLVRDEGGAKVTPGDNLFYGVTYRLKGLTSSNTATTTVSNANYTTTLSAANGQTLPTAIKVSMNGVTATLGTDYTWNSTTGVLTIYAATNLAMMGPITIAAGGGLSLMISYTGPSDGTFVTSSYYQYCDNRESFDVISPTIPGYTPDKTEVKGTFDGENLTATVAYTANSYTVAFDANGGTGIAMAPMSFTYGASQTLTACTFTRAGYTFAGWATVSNSTTAVYTDGQSVKNLASTSGAQETLYAVWAPMANIQYHVNHFKAGLDGFFGINPDETESKFGTAGQQTAAVAKTYEGFTARSFQQVAIAGDKSTVVDIYYDRDVHTVSVIYAGPSDGTFSAPAQHTGDVVYGATYSVESPTVTGYAPDVATVAGTMGTSDVSETVTYSPIAYTVAFDSNGGTGSMAPMAFAYGTAQDLTACGFTAPAGHHFAGWAASAADAAAGTVAYADGASVGNLATAQDAVVTLFAVWTEDGNVTISYVSADATRGTVAPGSESLAPATGEAKGAVATALPGYRLVNWTVPGGMHTNSVDGQAAGSALAAQSDTVAGTDPTLTPAQVDAVAKASGAYVATTFTANFEPITYSIAYNANGGSGTMSPTTLAYGTAGTLAANAFVREGHTFSGWNTMPDGTGTSFADGASVGDLATVQDATVTLYAQWTFVSTPTPANPTTSTKPDVLAKTGDVAGPVALGLIAMAVAGAALLVVRRRRA